MEQFITTGFSKIHHSIQFQPETPKKGKDLFESGHFFDVIEKRVNGISKNITSRCCRQTNIRSDPYSIKLEIDSERNVIKTSCTCVYNKSEKCKHIAGLIHYLNNERSLTKTDHEQLWGKPSKKALINEKYSKVPAFQDLFPKTRKMECENQPPTLEELKSSSHLKSMLSIAAKDKEDLAINLFINQVTQNHGVNYLKMDCMSCLDNFWLFLEDYQIYTTTFCLDLDVFNFYNDQIVLTKDQIKALCCETTTQSKCKEWYQARELRITASENVHSVKIRKIKTTESLVSDMLNPKKINTDATEYGKRNEEKALQLYIKTYNVEVKKIGLLVSHLQPWLCGSLDGVVVENGCLTKIVEIKCPKSCINKCIVDFNTNTTNVDFLIVKNNDVILNPSHKYFTQCQIQMYLTGVSECDLFCYTPVEDGSLRVPVLRDEIFLRNVIPLCEKFYFESFLPALKDKFDSRNSDKNISKYLDI